MFRQWGCYWILWSFIATVVHAEHLQLCNQANTKSKRCLNEHLFVPSFVSQASFLTTAIGTAIEGQLGRTLDMTSKPYRGHGVVAGGVNYDLQIAVLDWLAINGSLSGEAVSGEAGDSEVFEGGDFLNFGAGGRYSYVLGSRFLLWQNQRFIVSSNVSFVGTGYTGFDPIKFASSAFDLAPDIQTCFNRSFDREKRKPACANIKRAMSQFSYKLGFKAEFSFAMGINSMMGFWSNVGYQQLFRSPTDAADLQGQVYSQLAFSLDMAPISPIPIGLIIGSQYAYRFDNKFFDFGALILHGGIFYTGSSNFSVGIEVADEIVPVGFGVADERSNLFSGNINFRYYWN